MGINDQIEKGGYVQRFSGGMEQNSRSAPFGNGIMQWAVVEVINF